MAEDPIPQEPTVDYGARLTRAEYERRISELNASCPAMPTRAEEQQLRSAELSLLIDYHLGLGFPEGRRAHILRAHRKLGRHFIWHVLVSALRHPLHPSDGLARAQVRGLSKFLSNAELASLLDLTLDDVARLKK